MRRVELNNMKLHDESKHTVVNGNPSGATKRIANYILHRRNRSNKHGYIKRSPTSGNCTTAHLYSHIRAKHGAVSYVAGLAPRRICAGNIVMIARQNDRTTAKQEKAQENWATNILTYSSSAHKPDPAVADCLIDGHCEFGTPQGIRIQDAGLRANYLRSQECSRSKKLYDQLRQTNANEVGE